MANTVHARWQCEETARVLSSATIATGADPSKFGGKHAAIKGSEERAPGDQQNKRLLDALAQGLSPPAHSPALTTRDVSPTEQQRHFRLGADDVTGKPALTKATAEAPTPAATGEAPAPTNVRVYLLVSTAPTSKTEPTNVVNVLSRGLLDRTRSDKQRPIELPPANGLLPRLTNRENYFCARQPNRDFLGLTQDDFAAAILSLKSASRSDSLPILSSEPISSRAAGIAILPAEPKPSQADIATLPPVERTTGLPSKSLRFAISGAVIILAWTLVPPSPRPGVESSSAGRHHSYADHLEQRRRQPPIRSRSAALVIEQVRRPERAPRQAVASSTAGSSSTAQSPREGIGASVAAASGKRAPAALPVFAILSLGEKPSEVENTKATTPTSSDWDASRGIASSPAAHGPQTESARTAIAAPASDQQGPGTVPTTVASLPAARPSQIESAKTPVGPVSGLPTPAMAAPSAVALPPAAQHSEVQSNGAKVAPASGPLAPAAQQVGAVPRLKTDEIAILVDRGMQSLKSGDLELLAFRCGMQPRPYQAPLARRRSRVSTPLTLRLRKICTTREWHARTNPRRYPRPAHKPLLRPRSRQFQSRRHRPRWQR